MVPEAFVRGIRDLGYRSNGDAIAELIDNALQAFADRVDIVFGYDGTTSLKKPVQLAVIDNGHGMEPDMIRMAVMWGGTHREDDRSGLGRYGYGLPCASVSLGRRFTVYSAVADSDLHAVTLDLDALAAGDYTDANGEIVVPEPSTAELPAFVAEHIAAAHPGGWRAGTVILIDKLDRLEWATTQGLRENLCRQFGVTYHKLRGEAGLYVDNEFVDPIDPLFLTPDFYLHDLDRDRAHALDPIRIEVRDPDTNAYRGAMTLRYAWLPPRLRLGGQRARRGRSKCQSEIRHSQGLSRHHLQPERTADRRPNTHSLDQLHQQRSLHQGRDRVLRDTRRGLRGHHIEATGDSLDVRMGPCCAKQACPKRSSSCAPRSRRPSLLAGWRRSARDLASDCCRSARDGGRHRRRRCARA